MSITAKIIEDSISDIGPRITTLELRYPRFIHAEFMTHRQFSRNASSSRAIPVERQIQSIREDTAMPIHWGKNQKGMQADEESDAFVTIGDGENNSMQWQATPQQAWEEARDRAIEVAEGFVRAGYHKQVVNRILEPFSHITVVMTTTTLDNFFGLRRHPDAQPEIKALADAMFVAVEGSTPTLLTAGEWHLPYVLESEREYIQSPENLVHASIPDTIQDLIKVSVSRCARVSYKTHDGKKPSFDADIALYDRLVGSVPLHASPAEHQATPDTFTAGHESPYGDWRPGRWDSAQLHGNFEGWKQYRKMLDGECIKQYEGSA